MPIAGLSRVVCEGNHGHGVLVLDGDQGKGKPMQDQFPCAKPGCLARYRYERRVGLSEELGGMLEGVQQASSEPGLFHFIPGGGFRVPGQFPC